MTYGHSQVPALCDLSFSLEEGQVLGLLGPNGAGKSTAMALISTRLRPQHGSLQLAGQAYQADLTAVRRQIGLVPQDIALYTRLTARENLDYFASLHGMGKTERRQRIAHCLMVSQLEEVADRLVATYSGGMKRRLNIGVALLHQPRLLLLDEPTVGIDAQSRQAILDSLQELARQGMSLIYCSHYMEEIEQLCQQVIILDQGRPLAYGSPQQLIKEEQCANLGALFLKLTGRQLREG